MTQYNLVSKNIFCRKIILKFIKIIAKLFFNETKVSLVKNEPMWNLWMEFTWNCGFGLKFVLNHNNKYWIQCDFIIKALVSNDI